MFEVQSGHGELLTETIFPTQAARRKAFLSRGLLRWQNAVRQANVPAIGAPAHAQADDFSVNLRFREKSISYRTASSEAVPLDSRASRRE
jgi:hypothetical protein